MEKNKKSDDGGGVPVRVRQHDCHVVCVGIRTWSAVIFRAYKFVNCTASEPRKMMETDENSPTFGPGMQDFSSGGDFRRNKTILGQGRSRNVLNIFLGVAVAVAPERWK